MSAIAETMTCLRARGRCLAKTLRPDATWQGYDKARTFDVSAVPVAGLDDIAEALAVLLPQSDRCVIRGELIEGTSPVAVRRLLHLDKTTGELPTFREEPRRWLALDVEGVERPPGCPVADLPQCASVALRELPGAFQQAASIIQASAGHGFKPDLRLRLWFWLDRPISGAEASRWLKGTPADASVFRAVQPIYTAAPILPPDMPDPIPQRLVRLSGAAMVAVPARDALAPQKPACVRPTKPWTVLRSGLSAYVAAALRSGADKITMAGEGNRHPTLVAEARRLARFVAPGLLDAAMIRSTLADAARQAGKDDDTEIDAAIDWGLDNPWTDGPMPETRNGR